MAIARECTCGVYQIDVGQPHKAMHNSPHHQRHVAAPSRRGGGAAASDGPAGP